MVDSMNMYVSVFLFHARGCAWVGGFQDNMFLVFRFCGRVFAWAGGFHDNLSLLDSSTNGACVGVTKFHWYCVDMKEG